MLRPAIVMNTEVYATNHFLNLPLGKIVHSGRAAFEMITETWIYIV